MSSRKPNGGEPGGEVITEGVLTVTDQSAHKPRDKIYRVVTDQDGHAGQFWSPRKLLKTEAEWRSRDAVMNKWNKGGAYIVVQVPPPPAAFIGEIGPQDYQRPL